MMGCCRESGCRPGLGFIPVLLILLLACTVIITYSISVSNGHVYPYFPTISDTGGQKPESNVFSLLLGFASFVSFIVAVLKFLQFQFHSENEEGSRFSITCTNRIGLVLGFIASLGMAVVAAFQERGQSLTGHMAGAVGVFGGGVLYCWCQTYLSHRMLQCGMISFRLCVVRLIISILATVCLFLVGVGLVSSTHQWKSNPPSHPYEQWQPGDPGYAAHLVCSVSEWLCSICLMCYFGSFVPEFNEIKIDFNIRRNDIHVIGLSGNEDEERRPIVYA